MGHKGRSSGWHECSRSHGCDNAAVHTGQISARYVAKTETVSKLNLNGAIKKLLCALNLFLKQVISTHGSVF